MNMQPSPGQLKLAFISSQFERFKVGLGSEKFEEWKMKHETERGKKEKNNLAYRAEQLVALHRSA
jgi:hypothetical protein